MFRPAYSRLIVLAVICILPSCAHVQDRDIAARAKVGDAEVTKLEKSVASTSGESDPSRKMISVKKGQSKSTQLTDIVRVSAQEEVDSPPLDPLPEDTESDLADTTRQPEPIDFAAGLSLADLEELAIENNPSLQQAAAVIQKARGIQQQVGLYPNPTIGYTGDEMGDNGTAGQQGGFINQTIVTGDKLKLNEAVAGWGVEGMSWEYQAQRFRVLSDVRLRYFDVLGAQRRVSIAEDLLRVADAGVKTAEDLRRGGEASRPDVLQTQVDLNEVRITLQNARLEYEAAWKQLTSVLGLPEMTPVELHGELQEATTNREWETIWQHILANSPELQSALTRVEQARVQIQRQEAQPIPNLLTAVGVTHNNDSGDELVNVQVGIPLPVFNRNQGAIAVAQAEYNRAIRDVERLQLNLRNRLAMAFRDQQQAKQQVERYSEDIIPTAKENLELTEAGYKQGEFNFLRVLTARRTYFETNLRYVQSLIAQRQAGVVLDGLLLTGGLEDVPDVSRGMGGIGQRGQALSQQ